MDKKMLEEAKDALDTLRCQYIAASYKRNSAEMLKARTDFILLAALVKVKAEGIRKHGKAAR